jgi:hypothetical protein
MKTKHRSFTFQGRTLAALETAHFSAVQDRLESEVFPHWIDDEEVEADNERRWDAYCNLLYAETDGWVN